MRKLFFLVLTITAFASPLVQDEKLPDLVVKEPEVEKELTVERKEEEAGSLVQDKAVADSVLLEPETTEKKRVPEETRVMLEEPVLVADYLIEEVPETILQPELEITATGLDKNIVEEVVAELESETNIKVDEKEENVVKEVPTLEADYIIAEDPEMQMDLEGKDEGHRIF
ncbi:uncharacterized protein si:ch211-160b11.4 isoform X2 [Puntigrus tetrazona]|uniref:uncharacterized protein si:ch211-160b11.4 isoform X2 n=1 Tax=Puntigrus tetrazona TaxID=1606681 RepID=UPI001C8AD7D7|nr:uncharacterized protein si:ch211-160b11.4 isoform X2 [Puntigrus tetrazona]XP_043104208.1 uncharacterized protein si:ch211-160b11.4 isoform X2 [Puntigrus tetrazona]XP_043104209.1 uncharacterized protein si:ch211-160b11.4 isoform X2 [Puntigrus tetrazona]